jgi:hypothetical protein
MKAYLPYLLLVCSSFTSASPIQTIVPTNSPSRSSLDHTEYTTGIGDAPSSSKSHAYVTQPQFPFHVQEHCTHDNQLSLPHHAPTPPFHLEGRQYGSFFGKSVNATRCYLDESNPLKYDVKSTSPDDLTTQVANMMFTINKYGPECVVLTLFVLVPLIYLVLRMLELAVMRCIRERFPHRGRERVRLFGPERQLRAWSNLRREQFLEDEKRWWQRRRARY